MSTPERYVYLLFITRSWDRQHWSEESRPDTTVVFDDAWSAIQAGRAELGTEAEKLHIEPDDHADGVVWLGGADRTRMVVRRQKVWPTKDLDQ